MKVKAKALPSKHKKPVKIVRGKVSNKAPVKAVAPIKAQVKKLKKNNKVSTALTLPNSTPSVHVSASLTIQVPTNVSKMIKGVSKGGAIVDVNIPNHTEYHVVADKNNAFNGKFLDATLNCSDLGHNNNKFYIIQVVAKDSNPNQYYYWNRWGRVGVVGQYAFSSPVGYDEAVRQFLKKYREKTASTYTLIDIDYSAKNESTALAIPKAISQSRLAPKVQEFINLIYNLNIMKQQMMEIGYDANKMPLGKLGQKTLREGYNVLKSIETEIRGKRNTATLKNLSSDFYTLIPHNFGFQKMENFIINNDKVLKEKIDLLESLGNIEIAANIIKESEGKGDVIDQHYEKLHCKIDYIQTNSEKYKMLQSYLYNTGSDQYSPCGVTLLDAYELNRDGEDSLFKDLGNKMLLWHGSGINNFVGILSQGMRIAPPEAPSTGYNFGKGVYFADMSAKSLNYCRPSNGVGLILLCEVAVGTPKEYMTTCYDAANLPNGFNSTKGCGMYAPPESLYTYQNNVAIPNAKGEKTSYKTYLGYNEYIVYDTKQVKLKYVMKFKLNN